MFCDRSGDRVPVQAGRKQRQHLPFSTTPVTGPPRAATLVMSQLASAKSKMFRFSGE